MDDREKNSEIEKELLKIDVVCTPKRMKIGDYQYENVVIEMKSIDDFAQSIIDGRLKKQIKNMEDEPNDTFLMVHGRISDRTSDVNENCIIGMLVSLSINNKTKIIWVDNERQIAFAMKRVFERYKLIAEDEYEYDYVKEESKLEVMENEMSE